MTGDLVLIGGEEFADGFEEIHAHLATLLRGQRGLRDSDPLKVVFLPTCAADDGPDVVDYWCNLATQRLEAAGCSVLAPHLVDHTLAQDSNLAAAIAAADWIYLGGGYPHVGMRVLSGTLALRAIQAALQSGAMVAGASAGAMMLCAHSWVNTPEFSATIHQIMAAGSVSFDGEIPLPPPLDCLGWLPRSMCWPHTNRLFAMKWVGDGLLPKGHLLIGIDEQTALIVRGSGGLVLGRGRVFLVNDSLQMRTFTDGMHVPGLPSATAPKDGRSSSNSVSTWSANTERGLL